MKNALVPRVRVEVVLGSPRARCSRFGICEARVLPLESWQQFRPMPRLARAWLVRPTPNRLEWWFPADGMMPITRAYFFGGQAFRVEAPKTLPSAVLRPLHLKSCTILPGWYPFEVTGNGDICLPLRLSGGGLLPLEVHWVMQHAAWQR
jgi:hypothetical protein